MFPMVGFIKRYYILIGIIVLLAITGCASSRKNTWIKERKKSGFISTSQLGKNKYYFSNSYQKRLTKSMKKKR